MWAALSDLVMKEILCRRVFFWPFLYLFIEKYTPLIMDSMWDFNLILGTGDNLKRSIHFN